MTTGIAARLMTLALTMAIAAPAAAQFASSTQDYLSEYDRDRDGRVSLAEYQDKLSEVFRRMDGNGNGIVDLDEFDPAVVGPNTRPISLVRHRARLAEVFRRQDVNRNGYLDTRELGAPPR
jgi:Ca2+-binding EF-hand superfamily protein